VHEYVNSSSYVRNVLHLLKCFIVRKDCKTGAGILLYTGLFDIAQGIARLTTRNKPLGAAKR
jgi:hypothetical protein